MEQLFSMAIILNSVDYEMESVLDEMQGIHQEAVKL